MVKSKNTCLSWNRDLPSRWRHPDTTGVWRCRQSLVRAGGYFPGSAALFILVHRTSSQKFTTFQNAYCPGKMDQWKDTLSVAKYLGIPICDSRISVPLVMRAHSMTSVISEGVRPGAWEAGLVWRLLGNGAGEGCALGTPPGFTRCFCESSKMELPL